MTKTLSLAFSQAGILNPSQIKAINKESEPVDVVLFGNGSVHSLEQIKAFASENELDITRINRLGLGIPPLYALRVTDKSGEISLPNYVYDEDTRAKWFCTNIAAPHVEIWLSDISSQSQTQVKLDSDLKQLICYKSYILWKLLQVIEEQLCFPAVVLDKMTRWTQRLTPQSMDIELLRKETGVASLDYNYTSDLLSMTIGEETYTVKLSMLDEIYGKMILRQFNSILGRRLHIAVAIGATGGTLTEPVNMSHGELGRIIEGMRIYTKETKIDDTNPLPSQDLVEFTKRVEINDQTCIWVEKDKSLLSTIETHFDRLVRRSDAV
jgi:hypothetical protein